MANAVVDFVDGSGESDTVFHFNLLPDNILLQIFSYLSVTNLCRIKRVCQNWRRVGCDMSLWKHVDLSREQLVLTKVWKLVRSQFSDVLQSLHLCGKFHKRMTTSSQKSSLVSDAMMTDLRTRCPNLKHLSLINANITNLDSAKFPPSLTRLTLDHCLWPSGWLKAGVEAGTFSHLISLNVARCHRIDHVDMADIVKLTHLKRLTVDECYRLKDADFTLVSQTLTNLELLEMRDTGCLEVGLVNLGIGLVKLISLRCGKCKITNQTIRAICLGDGYLALRELDIEGCVDVNDDAAHLFEQIPRLGLLNIRGTSVVEDSGTCQMDLPWECNILHDNGYSYMRHLRPGNPGDRQPGKRPKPN